MQGPRVGPVSERRHGTLKGAKKQIPVPIKPIGDLRGQSDDKPEPSTSSGPPLLRKDPPDPASGIKRVRFFCNYQNRDPSHPDAPGNAGIVVQPKLDTPDYSSLEYDCAVYGPPPLDQSPVYDWHYRLIIPAADERVLDV